MSVNRDKLRELILYLAQRSEADPHFGRTKLNKLLFYIDFSHYARTGLAVTGEPYVKQPHGPVPAHVKKLLNEMEQSGDLRVVKRHHFTHVQERPKALREPDLSGFTGLEIALASEIVQELWPLSGADVSDLSHEFVGWRAVRMGEEIPYETALIVPGPPSEEEERWAEALVAAGR